MKYIKILSTFLLLCVAFKCVSVNAASASISFSTNNVEIQKGDTFTVAVEIEADEEIGEVEAFITYDSELASFKDGGVCASGGEGIIRISDSENYDQSKKKKYVLKFKAIDIGMARFSVSTKPMVYNMQSAQMSVSNNTLSIEIIASTKTNTDASLDQLKIYPSSLEPSFDSTIYKYNTIVDEQTDQLVVSAYPSSDKAKVDITGNKNLDVGSNKVIIKVTAESGDTKEYVIDVEKKLQEDVVEDNNNSNVKDDIAEDKEKIKVENIDGDVWIKGTYKYKINPLNEDLEVPIGYEKTRFLLQGNEIEVYVKKNDSQNEFLLLYGENEQGEENFYLYDRREQTMQRYVSENLSTTNDVVYSNDKKLQKEYDKRLSQMALVVAVLCSICAILMIGIINLWLRRKEKHAE